MLKEYLYNSWEETIATRTKEAKEFEAKELRVIKKLETVHSKILKEFPKEVNARVWVHDYGTNRVNIIIILADDAPKTFTSLAKKFMLKRYHKIERDFSTCTGKFSWTGEKKIGEYIESMEIRNTDPQNCKITPYKTEVTMYKSDCEGKSESTK